LNTRMRLGRMTACLFTLGIFILILIDAAADYENETLLLVCNTLFTGIIPLIVAVIAGYAYAVGNVPNALFMSCGMLAFGLGSVLAGFLRFLPDSANISVTIYNTCALFGAVCQLASSQKEYVPQPGIRKNRRLILALAISGTCLMVACLLIAALNGQMPRFMDQYGFTRLRDAVLWLATAFYLCAFLQMNKQYRARRMDYLYWYDLSLLMIALGLFAVCASNEMGTPLNWTGRAAQYVGSVFAFFSMAKAIGTAKRRGSSLPAIMADFFAEDSDNYINLAEHTAAAVITADETGRIFFANPAAERMLHYEKRELFRTSFFELLPKLHQSRIRLDFEIFAERGVSGLCAPVEMELLCKGERRVPVEIAATYHALPAGYACTYVLYDLTERKRAAQALRRQEALLQAVIDGTDDPVFLKDANSMILMGNRALSLAIGMPLYKIIGKTDDQVYNDPEKAREIMKNDRQVFLSRTAQSFEEEVPTPQGIRTYLSTKTPWLDESGSVQGVIGIAHDITTRKAMETELLHKSEELEEKNKLITDFFINISHEFKTPLSIIVLLADMMEQENKSMDIKNNNHAQFVNMLRMNAYRLRRLVANLLDITKLDAGFMEPHWEQADVVALLKSVVISTDVYSRQKGLTLHFSSNLDQMFMSTDSLMLERILLNLLSNAMKHTPSGGAIHVDLQTIDDKVTIIVADNGEGIPDEKKNVIFDRFRQVNTSLSRTSEGCGIGLSITKALTELLGGSIAFESSLHVGSTFYVTLPVMHEADAGYAADYSGMGLESLVQMELSDIDFGQP
jgi:PAS domain S-box-containing protein